ncbi:MAG: hypothetical protein ABUK01_06025, partial [Leptospirales bacterium]
EDTAEEDTTETTEETAEEDTTETTEDTAEEDTTETTEETTEEDTTETTEETAEEDTTETTEETAEEDNKKDDKSEKKVSKKWKGYKPPGGFFSRYKYSGFYAGLQGGWHFSYGPHLNSGGVLGLFVQWRQSAWLSGILQVNAGVIKMEDYTFIGTDVDGNGYELPFRSQDTIGYFAIGLGPIFHYHITEKIVPEIGLSFYFVTHHGSTITFGYDPAFSIRPGVIYNLTDRLVIGLHAAFLFTKVDTVTIDSKFYILEKTEASGGTSIMLSVRYKIF